MDRCPKIGGVGARAKREVGMRQKEEPGNVKWFLHRERDNTEFMKRRKQARQGQISVEKRLVTSPDITTDSIAHACPLFGKCTERCIRRWSTASLRCPARNA
eukprot:760812-Hanusia_phi.AAC.1